ncbi:MAG: aminotransferase class III-fold pyridoxal phosphate-dependent enzyme [Candidatus Wallbacteria bacterium]|nr:aminotransferase class III-fold pyridoxal phosphate-dependent enzyme [Candidatus Wallbacteria bacterium]
MSENTDKVVETTSRHTYGTWRKQRGWKPLNIADASGAYFTDVKGRRYFDLSSQLMCSNLGHKNQAMIESIARQAQDLAFISPAFTCKVRAAVADKLLEVVPKGLEKFFFATSGTEANEAAFKIARAYTGKYKIISRYRSYHGSTAGTIGATGDLRRWSVEPSGKTEGILFAPDCYCYRCPFGQQYPACGTTCATYLDYMLTHEKNVAAVIVEPIVGTNGILVPTDDYLIKIREITRRHGVLLIADEVMSAWGRTGEWFAVDHWKVVPDILTTAKGVTGAYVPLGVTVTTREIADYFEDHTFSHGHTYEAHPLTLAPALTAIDEYRRLNLIENARELGAHLGRRLNELKERHPSVGDVRGLGLFWAVELVKNRGSKQPFNTMDDKFAGKPLIMDTLTKEMMDRGVYVMGWISHMVLAPPLVVTKDDLELGLKALDEVLALADKHCS